MVITYHGGAFVKVTFGDTTIAVNPISKKSKLKTARFGADIVLVSLQHEDSNGVEQVTHGDKRPFVVDGPGEYEVRKVFIKGISSLSKYNDEEKTNTIYSTLIDGMKVCFLGFLSSRKLSSETKALIGIVDVLFVPIGGKEVLGAADAHELAVTLEAKMIIPVLYDNTTGAKQLKTFLEEGGVKGLKPVDKLTLKKRDLEGKEGEVVILKN